MKGKDLAGRKIQSLDELTEEEMEVYENEEIQARQNTALDLPENVRISTELYAVMFKDKISGSMNYGRTSYDFQHGTLVFLAPGQVIETPEYEGESESHGWVLMFHPDLIRSTALEQHMDAYTFFDYEINEALHLSIEEQDYLSIQRF